MADVKIVIGATDNASRVLSGVRTSMAQAEKAAAAFGSALGLIGVAGIGGLVAIGRSAINAIDAFNDLKDATGASIENISALEDVALRTGTSFDTVQGALIKFNAALNNAKPGSDAEKSFDAIGLSIKELKNLDPAEALLKTSQALAGFADDGDKARFVQEQFGKSIKEVAPFLKDLAEKGKLVATVTTEQAEAAENFNKALFGMQKNAQDAARALTNALLPALTSVLNGFQSIPQKINLLGLAGDVLEADKALKSLESRRGSTFNFAGNLEAEITKASNRLAAAKKEFNAADTNRPSVLADQSDAETRRLNERKSLNLPELKTAKGTGPKGPDPDADFKRFMENLQRQIEKTQDLTATEQLLADIQQGRLSVSPAQQAQLQALATELDLIKQTTAASEERVKTGRALDIEINDAVNKGNQAYQDRIKTLLDNTPSAVLQKQRDDVLLLTKAFEDGRISQELYEEAIISRLDLVAEKTKDAKTFAQELGLTFTSAFEDAIVNGKGLRDVLDGIGKDIAKIIIRKQVTEPFANAIGNMGSSFGDKAGSFLSNLFSFSGGGSTGNGPRSGGLDGQGGFMAMLHPKETVIDHTKGRAAGGVTIVQNINIDSRSDQATIMAAMRTAADMAKAEIMRSSRSGGAFA